LCLTALRRYLRPEFLDEIAISYDPAEDIEDED